MKRRFTDDERRERQAARARKNFTTHGRTRTPEYIAWASMRARCNRPNTTNYQHYGGRGIHVCERWDEAFAAFLADLGPKPSPKHELERVNNDGNYEPGNVVWALRIDQMNNTRHNRRLTIDGRTLTVSQWARVSGIKMRTIWQRLHQGMPAEQAVFRPLAVGGRWH